MNIIERDGKFYKSVNVDSNTVVDKILTDAELAKYVTIKPKKVTKKKSSIKTK